MRERIARALLQLWKTILSPIIGFFGIGGCKYLPTCSEYAFLAINRHGFLRGTWLALKRIARCGPWSQGGFDPIP